MKIEQNICLLVIIWNILGCNQTIYEKENNNTLSQSNPIDCPNTIIGKLNHIQDKDFYTIQIKNKSSKKLSIKLQGIKGHDVQLSIYENRQLIKKANDYPKNKGERLDNISIKNTQYTIEVSQAPSYIQKKTTTKQKLHQTVYPSKEYSFKCTFDEQEQWDLENNDTPKNAQAAIINTPIHGNYSPFYTQKSKHSSSSKDAFIKNLKKLFPKQSIAIETLNTLDIDFYSIQSETKKLQLHLSSPEEVDGILCIIEEVDKQLKTFYLINSHGIGETEQLANLITKPSTTYYIGVAGIPHEYKTSPSYSYSYYLNITERTFQEENEESEKNDTCEQANTITQDNITGYLSPANDKDCFKIEVPQQQNPTHAQAKDSQKNTHPQTSSLPTHHNKTQTTLNATLKGVYNLDLMLYLYDQNKNLRKVYNTTGKGLTEKIINYTVANMKHFYLLVKGSPNNTQENIYTPYQLQLTLSEANPKLEIEPNDYNIHSQQANENHPHPLSVNQKILGYIHPGKIIEHNILQNNDIDTYSIKLQYNTRYTIIFKGLDTVKINVKMHQENGYPVKSFKNIITRTKKIITRTIYETPEVFQKNKQYAKYYIQVLPQDDYKSKLDLTAYELTVQS